MYRRAKGYVNDKRNGFKNKRDNKKHKKQKRRLVASIVTGLGAVGIGALALFSRKEGRGGMFLNLTDAIKSNEPIKNLLDDLLPDLIFDLPESPDIDLDTVLENLGDRNVDLMDFGDIQDFAEELYWETRETLAESQLGNLGETIIRSAGRVIE